MASEEFTGIMTYNIINPLKKKPGKYMFVGYIQLNDINGQPTSYKVISFRTQVIYQGQRVGTNALKNKKVTFKGQFKENNWNNNLTYELMAEEMYIDGMERLAMEAANQSETSTPQKPEGTLAPAGASIQQNVSQIPVTPVTPSYVPSPVPNVIDTTLPQSNQGMVPQPPIQQNINQTGPGIIPGGFIAN